MLLDSFPSLMPADLTLKISDSGVNPILSNLNVAYAIQPHEISFLASIQGEKNAVLVFLDRVVFRGNKKKMVLGNHCTHVYFG